MRDSVHDDEASGAMRVSVMREVDATRVADLILRAIENVDQGEALPRMAYMMRPEHTPGYVYKHYNVRSRHLRLTELFLVAHDGGFNRIDGVLSVSEIGRKKCYLTVLALEEAIMKPVDGCGIPWFIESAMQELSRFVELDALRFLVMEHGTASESVGPHVMTSFLRDVEQCGFLKLARLENEGGHDIHVEIYERPVP